MQSQVRLTPLGSHIGNLSDVIRGDNENPISEF